MNKDEFINELKKINIELTNEQLNMLEIYKDYLLEYNKHTNLTAIKEDNLVYLKHFYDSLTILKYLDKGKLLDIGTGAGFPGMVIAICNPNIEVTLLDSNNKKITFLNNLVNKLQLKNVTLIHDRAENYVHNNKEKFDYVTSRAVAQLRILCELGIPALKIHGLFIAMKGNLEEELNESKDTIELLNSEILKEEKFKLPVENSNRENLILIKNSSNSDIYPRSYEKIVKKPLVK